MRKKYRWWCANCNAHGVNSNETVSRSNLRLHWRKYHLEVTA